MTTATTLQAATAAAVTDLGAYAKAITDLNAANAIIAQLKAQVGTLITGNATLQSQLDAANGKIAQQATQINALTDDNALYVAQAKAFQADALRWQKARTPDPTTYDQFFKDGGITSTSLSAAAADAAMDLAIAGKTPAGTFLGMYSMSVVKP